ncbi:fructose-specific PTS transporter subunit EIIC [Alcaligenaceae bacterium B3P038]|nr:fructose-specific PTS transporter subunit EIIC [Alcaligenaceae bacterium B3P038]
MNIVIVSAGPDGEIANGITARLLHAAAQRLGWQSAFEVRAAHQSTARTPLNAADIDAADWVLYVGTPADRQGALAGKASVSAAPADALKDPAAFLQAAAGRAQVAPAGIEDGNDDGVRSQAASAASAAPRIVAITACPTGVAHTFMAAEALQQAARENGIQLAVETRGSVGARNPLTPEDIAAADVVLLAVDIEVDTARFAGKRIYRCKTGVALKDGAGTLKRALAEGRVSEPAAGGAQASEGARNTSETREGLGLYKHLLTGVSYMLPMVVAGGLLIALSFVFGIEAFKEPGTLAAALKQTGDAAFLLMIPVLAGYIAYSIADRPGLAPGMIGGALAGSLGAGFIGGILAGFIGGYCAKLISKHLHLPASIEALKPILIIPLVASLITGMVMIYLVGGQVALILASLTAFLNNMGTTNAIALGVLLGAMMCIDLGGPINKAAYAFTVGLLASNVHGPMAVTMAAGMVPPIGMALATLIAKRKFDTREREAGKAAGILGMCFISEGAIPFAAKDPLRVIPASVIGGIVTGALVAWAGCRLVAPHGGFFVLLIPGAMNRPWMYILAILAGSVVTALIYAVIKRAPAQVAAVA